MISWFFYFNRFAKHSKNVSTLSWWWSVYNLEKKDCNVWNGVEKVKRCEFFLDPLYEYEFQGQNSPQNTKIHLKVSQQISWWSSRLWGKYSVDWQDKVEHFGRKITKHIRNSFIKSRNMVAVTWRHWTALHFRQSDVSDTQGGTSWCYI